MNINATTSHNPFLPIKAANNSLPDQAVHARDGSIKTGGTDNLSSLSPAIQQRIAALKSQASTTPEKTTSGRVLTIDGMRAAWGESGSIYDLNGDDTVNVQDLLKLLAAGGTIAHAEAPLTLEGLLDVYGQSNPDYDLNGDGIVNVKDILQLFAQESAEIAHGEKSASISEPAKPGATSPVEPSFDKPASTGLTGRDPIDSAAQIPPKSDSPHSFRNISDLRNIAQAIFQRLMGAGYEFKPPTNIHSLVDQLQLSTQQKQVIIDRLAERYPQGLGVNFVG